MENERKIPTLVEPLKELVPIAKSFGYHCYQTVWRHDNGGLCTYLHIANEDKSVVGYVQTAMFFKNTIRRSTCHVATKDWGTGISIDSEDEGLTPENITKEWLSVIFSTSNFGIYNKKPVPSKISVQDFMEMHKDEQIIEL